MDDSLYGRFRVSADYLELKPADRVLSVGCKEAELETRILGRVASITAVDIDSKIIEANQRRYPGITFEFGDIIKGMPCADATYDKIVFLEVLEHLPRGTEPLALKELYRVLKPGGVMVLSTPNSAFFTNLFDPAFWLIGHRHYRMSRVRELCEAAGFTVEASMTGGGAREMFWLPLFYILLRLGPGKEMNRKMEKRIDREYSKPGFQTNILKLRKKP